MFTLTRSGADTCYRNRVDALQRGVIDRGYSYAGGRSTLLNLHMPTGGRDGGYCAWYWEFQRFMTFEQYQQVAPVAQRLRQFHHFITEVDADWRNVPGTTVLWGDNSVEVTQHDRHGNTRTRTLVAAHGDVC